MPTAFARWILALSALGCESRGLLADGAVAVDAAGPDRAPSAGCRGEPQVVIAEGPVSYPRIAFSGRQFAVSFLQYAPPSVTSTLRVVRLTSAGQVIATQDITTDLLAPDTTIGVFNWPSVAGGGGRFVVAYANGKAEMVLRELKEDGALGPASVVTTSDSYPFTTFPTIGASSILLSWLEVTNLRPPMIGSMPRRVAAGFDLRPLGPQQTYGANSPAAISTATDGAGFVYVWYGFGSDLGFAKLSANGDYISTGGAAGPVVLGDARQPWLDVAVGDGGYGLAVGNIQPDTPPRFQALDRDGRAAGPPVVFANSSNSLWPAVAWDGARYLTVIAHFPYPGPGKTEIRVEAVKPDGTRVGTVSYDADPWDDLGTPDVVRGAGATVGTVWPHRTGVSGKYEVRFALVSCE
jgi:hypothetical protein